MKLPRRYRILTALVALFGVLFMQLAVASYACPGLQGQGDLQAAAADESPMPLIPSCDQPDPTHPALCKAHCQDGTASLDKPGAPTMPPAAVLVSTIVIPLAPLASASLRGPQPDSLLLRITSPPISIRHCCLRI